MISRLTIVSTLCFLCLAPIAAQAQTATTQAASEVTDITATLHGEVNPASESSYYYCNFQFGTDTSYGQSVSGVPYSVSGTTPVAVVANPPDLLPSTTYHYRVVMGPYDEDLYLGADMTFTTGPPATLSSYELVRADSIGDTAATFVVFNPHSGGSAATISIEYGRDTNYGAVYDFPDIIPVNAQLPYPSVRLTELIPDTTYHWRFKLTNAQGSIYSEDQSFTTLKTPILTTGPATNIGGLTATFNGTVNPMGQGFQVSFEWRSDTASGGRTEATPEYVYSGGTTAVSVRIGFLQPGTTYRYRVVAFANGIGAVYGPDQVFTTPAEFATINPPLVTDLGAQVTAAVDVGIMYSRSYFWFEYGTSTEYGNRSGGSATTQDDPLRPGFKFVNASFYNLLPGTLYHCRINVRVDDYGPISSGSDFTFTTAAAATPPTIVPPSPYSRIEVAPTGATLSVNLISGSSAATVAVEYGIDTTYGAQAVVPTPVPGSSYSDYARAKITSLIPNTTYHYRFKATNNEGTAVGTDGTFTTAELPILSTSPASDVGSSWARCNGTYIPKSANYEVTFEYGTSTAYEFSVPLDRGGVIVWNFQPTSVYADLHGITSSTTYHYRIKLADDYGNFYYGSDATFTTITPVEAWRQKFFNTTDGSGDREDLANPSGDGVSNLLKYALGLDPTARMEAPMPYPQTASDGEIYQTLNFSRVSAATDLTCEVQVADNPAGPWTTVATSSGGNPFTGAGLVRDIAYADVPVNGTSYTITLFPLPPPSYPGGDYFVTVRDTVPMSQASARFMRVRATR